MLIHCIGQRYLLIKIGNNRNYSRLSAEWPLIMWFRNYSRLSAEWPLITWFAVITVQNLIFNFLSVEADLPRKYFPDGRQWKGDNCMQVSFLDFSRAWRIFNIEKKASKNYFKIKLIIIVAGIKMLPIISTFVSFQTFASLLSFPFQLWNRSWSLE